MDASNSARFLVAYNQIDQAMQRIVGAKEYLPFGRLVDMAKRKHAAIRKFEETLREYAELRNAIVHHQRTTEYAIAEPHESVVAKLEAIAHALNEPVTVGHLFRRRVASFQALDTLAAVLALIARKGYDQFPVYSEGDFKGLLTTSGITHWLAYAERTDGPALWEAPLSEILRHETSRDNYAFIAEHASVYEAQEQFRRAIGHGKKREALLITKTGHCREPLLGIVTATDLMKIE